MIDAVVYNVLLIKLQVNEDLQMYALWDVY